MHPNYINSRSLEKFLNVADDIAIIELIDWFLPISFHSLEMNLNQEIKYGQNILAYGYGAIDRLGQIQSGKLQTITLFQTGCTRLFECYFFSPFFQNVYFAKGDGQSLCDVSCKLNFLSLFFQIQNPKVSHKSLHPKL